MPNGKHIVFDWNGTLLDDLHALHECTNKMLAAEGHKAITADDFRRCYNIPFERFYEALGFDKAQIAKMMSLENSVFHEHYEPLADTTKLRKGAAAALAHVRERGSHSYILSNHIVDPIRAQLKRLGIEHFFTDVLAYADRATQFRDMNKGERLRRYRETRGMAAKDTLIIGDTAEEIEIAREQNLTCVAITGGCVSEERLLSARPDYVIHSLRELPPILAERGFA